MWSEAKRVVKSTFYGSGTVTWAGTYDELPLSTVQELMWPPTKARNDQPVSAVKPRIAGLHAGAAWMSDDFDAPLPEDFLVKDE